MKCPVEGAGHNLVMPNLKVIYRNVCAFPDTNTDPIITEVPGATGQANMRIITIPCGGSCEKCSQIRAYGCRIKDCSLEDGRNTKTRQPFLLELSESDCMTFNTNIDNGGNPYTDITTFSGAVCTELESIGITGNFGDVVITGPVPAFAQPYTVAIIRDGICEPQDIAPFTAGTYILENCGGVTMVTIENSTPAP